MARVASDSNENSPFMDRLTHAVLKETSKSLKYYIDVKRRENGFVLNPNSTAYDSVPHKARFIYGTTKEYPPLYGSCHSDNDVKIYFNTLKQPSQQKYRSSQSTSSNPEKQMCRKELNYHMRLLNYSPNGSKKFSELRLGPAIRSTSSCSRLTTSDSRRQMPKSSFKSPRNERDQLVDDTAGILAAMVKTRRSAYDKRFISEQIPPSYDSRNANPSPRQIDEQSNISTSNAKQHSTKRQSSEEKARYNLERAAIIMLNAKPVVNRMLCDYKVTIQTGTCNGASTDAPIRMKFYGTHGYTDFSTLTDSKTHRVPFLKGQSDTFIVQSDHVGQLVGIAIGHDKKDIQASWFLNDITIEDPIREILYKIPCNSWLSNTSVDQKTMRDFAVTSMQRLNNTKTPHQRRRETDSQSSSSSTTAHSKSTSNTNSSQKNQRKSFTEVTTNESPKPKKNRTPSPRISSAASTDRELENTVANNRSSSSTSASTPKFNQQHDSSDEHPRPPARLEKRASPISVSPERPVRNNDETNETEAYSFFD